MTEFKQDFNSRERDPRLWIRTFFIYLKRLDNHIKNTELISKDTLEYTIDRMLELTFNLYEYSKLIYEDIDEDELKKLDEQDARRIAERYLDSAGKYCGKRDAQTIDSCIEASTKRYSDIRQRALEKINKE